MPGFIAAGCFRLALGKPLIMGVVNVTPDSFSDGGRFLNSSEAVVHARQMIEEGADMLDIGGESSRPGADGVSAEEEIRRTVPVIEALRSCGVPLSIDTAKATVMRAAIAAGASMVNDIEALQAPGALEVLKDSDAAVCLMHMQGKPRTMQMSPEYRDVVAQVKAFLEARAAAVAASGVAPERIIVDPGFGFGKTVDHNLELLRRLAEIAGGSYPVLAGLSRKSSLGVITGRATGNRLHASTAAALLAAERGAAILRVHDVAATRDALSVLAAVLRGSHTPT